MATAQQQRKVAVGEYVSMNRFVQEGEAEAEVVLVSNWSQKLSSVSRDVVLAAVGDCP